MTTVDLDTPVNPFLLRRRVRHTLRAARESLALTQQEVADALGVHLSTIIRAELGQTAISVRDIRAYADLYGLGDRIDELTAWAKGARVLPWREYRDICTPEDLQFYGYEASAASHHQFNPLVIPGLLQTREYTMNLMHGFGVSEVEAERRAELRSQRQSYALGGDCEVHFILDEAVLHRQVGSRDTMRRQADLLMQIDERDYVTIQVLPFSVDAAPVFWGHFIVLSFGDMGDSDIVYMETSIGRKPLVTTDRLIKEGLGADHPHRHAFNTLQTVASHPKKVHEIMHVLW